MKVNALERWLVNSPLRVLVQKHLLLPWIKARGLIPPEGVMLEIGCGRGVGASLVLREFQPSRVHALDLDLDMVSLARLRLPREEAAAIRLYVGDACRLPYREASMDAVFGFGVLHHLPDWRAGLSEVARVLKPGGFYVLEEFYPAFYLNFLARRLFAHPEEDRFESGDLRGALTAADLPVVSALEHKKLGILAVCRKNPQR